MSGKSDSSDGIDAKEDSTQGSQQTTHYLNAFISDTKRIGRVLNQMYT